MKLLAPLVQVGKIDEERFQFHWCGTGYLDIFVKLKQRYPSYNYFLKINKYQD